MKDIHQIHLLAERYIAKQLSPLEVEQLDSQLINDPEFAAIFSDFLETRQGIREAAEQQRKKELLALLHAENSNSNTSDKKEEKRFPRIILRRILAAAAVFFIAITAIWMWPSQKSQFDLAMAEVYETEIFDRKVKSDEQFTRLFSEGEYQQALALAKKEFEQADPTRKYIHLRNQGFCYWKLGEQANALTVFQELEKDDVLKPENNPARYYQALTLLDMGQKEEAVALLGRVVKEGNAGLKAKARLLLE